MTENYLKVKHNAGFFSCCTVRLQSVIDYYNKYNKLPVLDSSEQWSAYKDADGDITNRLFKTLDKIKVEKEKISITNSDAEDQFSDYHELNHADIQPVLDKYFTLSDEVLNIKQDLIRKYNIDVNKTLVVYFRGNDKCRETKLPTHEEMLAKLEKVRRSFPDHTVLLQSDEQAFYQTAIEKNIDFVCFNEILVHDKWNRLKQAQTFLAIVSIISDCDAVIMNSCNVSLWICLLRKHAVNIYQYLNVKKTVYGVKQKYFNPDGDKWIEKFGSIIIKFR
jgi:hypothetical protein